MSKPRWVNRKAWGAMKPIYRLVRLEPREVIGIAIHWPGMKRPIRGIDRVSLALRSWQRYHFSKDWSDIAYNEAIDQDGNLYRLRGIRHRSAANGSALLNRRYAAILLILAPDEEPSTAMLRRLRNRIRKYRIVYPNAHAIVPHSAIRPSSTDCPGDRVRQLIKIGVIS